MAHPSGLAHLAGVIGPKESRRHVENGGWIGRSKEGFGGMAGFRIKQLSTPAVKYGLALTLILGISLFLRISLAYDNVFVGDHVEFQENDPWYHMRLVENLVHHFPHRIVFDPYALYPRGQTIAIGPFFDVLLGFFIWIIGLGSPSKALIDTVGAYFPAVLGALATIPVYFIGRELFTRNVGLLAAALMAILPGGWLTRSLLGFTDHHVAETLLSALTMLGLILAVKSANRNGLSFSSLKQRDWAKLKPPLLYSLLSGIALGCYLLTWIAGSFIVFIILSWIAVQFILDHLKSRSTDYLCIIGLPGFLIALLMVLPILGQTPMTEFHVASLLIGLLICPMLSALSSMLTRRKMNRWYFLVALAGLGGVGLSVFYLVAPGLLESLLANLRRFMPDEKGLTVSEVKPLLLMKGSFSLSPVWDEFTTSFFLALISLIIIAYLVIKEGAPEKTLLLVWSAITFMATLGQNRFTYYLVVSVALLSAYLCGKALEWASFRKPDAKLQPGGDDQENHQRRGVRSRYARPRFVFVVIVIFFLVYYPNSAPAIRTAKQDLGPQPDFYYSLVWMRENTPDPFGDPNFYFQRYQKPAAGHGYDFPPSAYGVMCWWDYGYWIINIAHRLPNANPTQAGARDAGLFFTAQDEASANQWLDRVGSRYVIADGSLPAWHLPEGTSIYGKFHAMPAWAGESPSQFFEQYFLRTPTGKRVSGYLYYPKYFTSMCSRLCLFGGQAVVPHDSTWVIAYAEKTDLEGRFYKEMSSAKKFATYEEAQSYLASQPAANHRIVSLNPFVSCVPLEALKRYKLVYKSPTAIFSPDHSPSKLLPPQHEIPQVQIFEYLPEPSPTRTEP